jgi:hypothetical protein
MHSTQEEIMFLPADKLVQLFEAGSQEVLSGLNTSQVDAWSSTT